MKQFLLLCSIGLVASLPVKAQEDAYHAGLRARFASEYGLTGGDWVIAGSENATAGRMYTSGNTSIQSFQPAGTDFSTAYRLTVPVRGENPWDYFIGFSTTQPLGQGDRALLVLWLRGVEADRGTGLVNANFEMNAPPWTKSMEKGLIPSGDWQEWLIPFEATIAHPAGQAQLIFHLGIMAQTIEIGGVALVNYGQAYALADLPATNQDQDYAGREPGAAWRAGAQARIETHRKRDLRVRVVDNRGVPVEGAAVTVDMKRHRFGFGTAVAVAMMLQQGSDAGIYRNKLSDLTGDGRTFSIAVLENALKWGAWENPSWPGNRAQTIGVVRDLRAMGMAVRGHNLVWPDWAFMPTEAQQLQNDPPALRALIENRIADVAGYPGIKGALVDWDVLNEPAHLPTVARVFADQPGYPTGEEIYAEWFQQAAAIDPTVKLYINEYSILSSSGFDTATQQRYKDIIALIEANGGRIDGIGMQGHMATPLTAPETVYEILDEFAALGKAIAITEYDAAGVDESLAADYMRDFLTVVFSHPAVESFLMWGFWDGAHWKDDAPLFRRDWSLKPSGQAFLDLVFGEWWTSEQGATDSSGELAVRGFLGDYEVTVDYEGSIVRVDAALDAGEGEQVVEVMLPRQVSVGETGGLPDRFEVLPAYPEPARQQATLPFSLPLPAHVRIELYDVLGRLRAVVLDEDRPAGRHRVTADTSRLPAGVYLFTVHAGPWQAFRTLTVIR